MEGREGQLWVSTLAPDQKTALDEFFAGSGDEQLERVAQHRVPPNLRRATLEGYRQHAIDPVLAQGRDFGFVALHGQRVRGTQAFRKELIRRAFLFLR